MINYRRTARNRRIIAAIFRSIAAVFAIGLVIAWCLIGLALCTHDQDIVRWIKAASAALFGCAYAWVMGLKASNQAEFWEKRATLRPHSPNPAPGG